jgi:hypothetical protein
VKDVFNVLHQKEVDLARVRLEVDSLRIAAPLLADDEAENKKPVQTTISTPSDAAATGTDGR